MEPPRVCHPLAYALKRAADRAVAGVGLVLTAPLTLPLAAAIRLESRGPALFIQDRIGQDGHVFRMYKFRTMIVGAPVRFNPDGSTATPAGDARITRLGRFLRGGIDELPQLINVLKGEMSIVGPRPEMACQAAAYTARERDKLVVPPGITSLAAVLGRNGIPWKQRIQIDLHYVDRWSLALDAKIALQTLLLPFKVRAFDFADVVEPDRGGP